MNDIDFSVSSRLTLTVVYNNGYHLATLIRNDVGHDIHCPVPFKHRLDEILISSDKMHLKDRIGEFYRKNMNPHNNCFEY